MTEISKPVPLKTGRLVGASPTVVTHYEMGYKNKEDWDAWNKRRYQRNEEFLRKLKASTPCFDCKKLFPHYVMEFDHVPERGKKKETISTLVGNRSVDAPTVQAELAKCDLVCANCHKIRTHERKQQG